METPDSFAAHSFIEVTHHVFCSAVIAVPAAVVVNTLKNIESIKRYGVDGGVISCCVMESLAPPTEVGSVRRCTLRLPPYAGKLIREKLTQYVEYRCYGDNNDNNGNNNKGLSGRDKGELKSVKMCMDYLPCEEGERSRSPFDATVDDAVQAIRTHIRVSTVTRTPHRCFVEMTAECVLRAHQGRHVTTEQKLEDKANQQAVTDFWRLYLDAQVAALELQVCKEAYPEVEARVDAEFATAFAAHEEVLCDWAAGDGDTVPRHTVTDELESVLVWWARALEAYQHQKMLTEIAEARVEREGPSAFALTRQLPRRFTELQRLNSPTRRASDSVMKFGAAAGDTNVLSDMTQTPKSNVDTAAPGFVAQRSLTSVPISPGTFLRFNSRGPGTTLSDTSRQSVLLPRDRRHTAVPQKGLLSASSLPDGALPAKAFSPGSSFLASPNAVNTSTSNVLQSSVLSHSGRRKQMAPQPPHLLQHAQRRTSNVNNLSNSVSRYSAASPTGSRSPKTVEPSCSEPTGFFFSQFFNTPTYTASATTIASATTATAAGGGTSANGPVQRPLSMNAAGAPMAAGHGAAVSGSSYQGTIGRRINTTASSTTVSLAASAAMQAPSGNQIAAAAVPPEVVVPFQPDMVRHLFSLTGVLHEDVARRIFLSLCGSSSQNDGTAPRLSAEGLKTVLRYVDLCGLREGAAASARGDALACDEAYRAEVRRCYYEQNTQKSTATLTRTAAAAPARNSANNNIVTGGGSGSVGNDPPSTDSSSRLSHLTARREASLRERDEAALYKLVQFLMSRFAFEKKQELSFEEFQLALVYLWNN